MAEKRPTMRELLATTPVLPVLTIHDEGIAPDLARALAAGGVLVFEVLMRTPQAPAAIRAMKEAVPAARIGAGTLLKPSDVESAVAAGASFGVSPGLTRTLAAAVREAKLPFLPGVSTASEIMAAVDDGFTELKLFPAQGDKGVEWLQNMAAVFPGVRFCPTGGIKPEHVPAYLALPNCGTIGCSWVAPAERVAARDWPAITQLARRALAIGRG